MMPQILILAVTPWDLGQVTKQVLGRRGLGQRGTDQHGIGTSFGRPDYVLPATEPAFRYCYPVGRNPPDDVPGRRGIDFKGVEVPTVDADNARPRRECGVELS